MFRIKRLHTFTIGTFLPLLLATFSVCLFILLMHFLWTYIGYMVGKGVGVIVLAKMFFYASVNLTSQALPLSVLLASLMTFGNLGEHFELVAMKASGISLLQIMKPLIVFILLLSAVSLYFQNDLAPRARTKAYTILLSLQRTSPELEIPEGSFCKEIPGYNVYVRHKDKKTGLLRNLMIYDYSKGFDNATVIVADSGRLDMADDKQNLVLSIYNGELFENYAQKNRAVNGKNLYRRETFGMRTFLIPFNSTFELVDESIMGSSDDGKSIRELNSYVDSVQREQDSLSRQTSPSFKQNVYANTFKQNDRLYRQEAANRLSSRNDSLLMQGWNAFYAQLSLESRITYLEQARNKTDRLQSDYQYTTFQQAGERKLMLSHVAQYYKRFSLALSCLLFFFIGAPLGAIIRKGGLGMPAVLSVFLYLLYYTVDLFGTKMVKQDVWPIWQGVWFSSAILLVLGVFFTYQALNDSTMLNPDDWKIAFQKFMSKIRKRVSKRK